MNDYELTFILKPNLAEAERDKEVEKIRSLVEKEKGKITSTDIRGKKLLAYPIKKSLEGIYIFMALSIGAKEVGALEKKLKLNEVMLRYLLVKSEQRKAKS